MEEERYVRFHSEGQGRALIEIARQYPPRDAIREFVTNSLDGKVQNNTEDIIITVNPSERRLIISDNGNGIPYQELIEKPIKVGFSEKTGRVDMRGEKALGLLAFGSLGEVMHIISKPYKDETQDYGYLRWEIKENKGNMTYTYKQITPREVKDYFYGTFPNGTRVIIDKVNPHILEKILTISNLKNWLRMIYNPALRKGMINLRLGKINKMTQTPKAESLEEIDYKKQSSSKLIDKIIPIPIKNIEIPGNLEILLFVDPEAIYDKVAVYSKDVLVYESLAELPEFSRSLVWTSGKVSGYINDYFNKLILGRNGIDRNRNTFKAWFNAIKELEEKIRPIVEEKKKHGLKLKENNYINEVFDAFADVWKDLKKVERGEEYTRSSKGDSIPVIGVEPAIERGDKKGKHVPREPTGRPPGPGTFRFDQEGYNQEVVPKTGVPIGRPQPIEFELKEIHLRSKLEDLLGVSPTLFLNSAHEDYKSRAESKDNIPFKKYILDLLAKEAAFYDVKKAEKEGKLIGNKLEIIQSALQKEEHIKFQALRRLGIK